MKINLLLKLIVVSISLGGGFEAGNLWRTQEMHIRAKSESEDVPILRQGEPIPQIFVAKIPAPNYELGVIAGFIIEDLQWPGHPFWQTAVVRDGWVIGTFRIGLPSDIGHTYRITGIYLPKNTSAPPDGEIKTSPAGEVFYGPEVHIRK